MLVLNHIHLFDCATPLLYVYMVIVFPLNYPRWTVLLWSFFLGLAVDTFSNTPGVASASMTLIGAVQPYFLKLFVQRDAPEDLRPSVRTIGTGKFVCYATVLVLIYCVAFFTLEAFNFFNLTHWALSVAGSAAVTLLLVLTLESVRRK